MKTVTILGSTGSVGVNTLNVIKAHADRFKVRGLAAAGAHVETFVEQVEAFSPQAVYLHDAPAAAKLSQLYGRRLKVFTAKEGLGAFSAEADADILVAAASGISGLVPVIDALERGRRVALANKEVLVVAGALVIAALKKNPRASLIPVDSEHNAIFQCLQGGDKKEVLQLVLTGSGGPLRQVPAGSFATLSKETVINHPKWKMGKKISVDSATLMNKGLEIIEASWLFDIPVDRIELLIHPEAVVHSMVEFRDGSMIAQLGVTDMRLPIAYALSFPERLDAPAMRLGRELLSQLTFFPPDRGKFPCLDIACAAARRSGSAPCVLSAADEVAVDAFLSDRVPFTQIPRVIEQVLARHRHIESPGLADIQAIHDWAVEEAGKLCGAPVASLK